MGSTDEVQRISAILALIERKASIARSEGFSKPLIALTGYSRQGKDTAAEPMLLSGYRQHAFGNAIKMKADELDSIRLTEMLNWMVDQEKAGFDDPVPTQAERNRVWNAYRYMKEREISPFVDDLIHKENIRAVLEWLGMWKYDEILERFFETMPAPVVNTRLMRVREAEAWVAAGGVVIEIIRDNIPRSPFEAKSMESLRSSGLIDVTIYNTATIPDLHHKVMDYVGLEWEPSLGLYPNGEPEVPAPDPILPL